MRRGTFTIKFPTECPYRDWLVCKEYDEFFDSAKSKVRHYCKKENILCDNIATFPKHCPLEELEDDTE